MELLRLEHRKCKKKKKKIKSPNSRFSSSEWDQEAPYLQVSWWGRSLCPEGPPPRWRWSSCRASRGQSGPPRRWRWASPPGGWARPSGRSPRPPAWPTCPPGSPRTWSWPWSPAPRTCCVQSCGGVCVCVCVRACVRVPVVCTRVTDREDGVEHPRLPSSCLLSAPWRWMLTPEVPPRLVCGFATLLMSSPLSRTPVHSSFFLFLCLAPGGWWKGAR